VLSILIPIYNFDCTTLVENLLIKINESVEYEIICIDDCSTESNPGLENLATKKNVVLIKLETNLGRSSIRNLLVEKSKYPWLLFLDADILPVQSTFIENYIDAISEYPGIKVFFGGIKYREIDMQNNNHLRYKYGINRESNQVDKRRKTPHLSMLMSNTILHRSVFDVVQLNPTIKKYGHEDAVFSYDLYKKGYYVKHIHNPVFHTGIETNIVFIEKTKVAVENLLNLYELGILNPKVNKLLQTFLKIKRFGFSRTFAMIYNKFGLKMEQKLDHDNPSLFIFDLFRLSYLCAIYHQKK